MDNYTSKRMFDVCEVEELSVVAVDLIGYVNKTSEQEMIELMAMDKFEKRAEKVEFDDLMKLSFDTAHKVIGRISFPRRLKLLEDLDYRLVHLYESTKGYNDQGFGKSLSPVVFQRIMGNIKHLEIVQNWLFGIE